MHDFDSQRLTHEYRACARSGRSPAATVTCTMDAARAAICCTHDAGRSLWISSAICAMTQRYSA